jgi:hypothetical protein
MDRRDIVQAFVDHRRARTYLEIGVKKGKLFLQVRAPRKLAVDPLLRVPRKRKWKAILKYPPNLFNEYHEMTSDKFFKVISGRIREIGGLDVVFIDGLHTYEQTWKDVSNALDYLNPNGVILMHDCSPASEAQATPAHSREHVDEIKAVPRGEAWSGDVWKTIVRLRSERSNLNVSVLDCDHGIGVIRIEKPEAALSFSADAIARMSYSDLEKDRRRLLNLRDPAALNTML